MFRKLRIAVLLLILATVALGAWRSGARATEWKHTLHATVYPIAADASLAAATRSTTVCRPAPGQYQGPARCAWERSRR